MAGAVQITPDSLKTSGQKFRKDLIMIPVYALETALQYMQLRTGIRGKETIGKLTGKAEMGPYDPLRSSDGNVKIEGRELETYFGSTVIPFDPNSVQESIYDSEILKGEGLKNVPITVKVIALLLGQIGESLFNNLFTAVRTPNGTKTEDLFDGFQTIVNKEINAGNVTAAKGNLQVVEALTAQNAETVLKDFYFGADKKLKGVTTNFFMSITAYEKYCKAYQTNHGALPYNNQYDKVVLEGSRGLCTLVPLANVPENFYILSTKKNLVVGMNLKNEQDNFSVEKSNLSHFWLDFVAAMYFGVQFEAIDKEFVCFGQTAGTTKYYNIGADDVTTPTAAKWGADAVLTNLKEYSAGIDVPAEFAKVEITQVNDALAVAFPSGSAEISGNKRVKEYTYAAVEDDITAGILTYDVLVSDSHNIKVDAVFYNDGAVVATRTLVIKPNL